MKGKSFKGDKTPTASSGGKNQPAANRQGASGQRSRLRDLLRGYFQHHSQLFGQTLHRLLGDPVQTIMTSLVIAIALGLPAGLYVAVENLQQVGNSIKGAGQLSVFLRQGAGQGAIDQLQKDLAGRTEIRQVSYVSPDEALEEFQDVSGFGDALALLDENPLPAVLLVTYSEELAVDRLAGLQRFLEQQALVADVSIDMDWVQRLHAILEIGRKLAFSLGLALSLGVLLIVGNTIRLAIENRRDEIIVVKLIGGTDSYVRRPFLYTGLWHGLLGGVISWLVVGVGLIWLNGPVTRLATLYQSSFSLQGLGFNGLLSLLGLGACLGLLGARVALSRHLAALEPG